MAGHVWIPGYWDLRNNHTRYVWVAGHYEKPGKHTEWAPPHWEQGKHGWEYYHAHWR